MQPQIIIIALEKCVHIGQEKVIHHGTQHCQIFRISPYDVGIKKVVMSKCGHCYIIYSCKT